MARIELLATALVLAGCGQPDAAAPSAAAPDAPAAEPGPAEAPSATDPSPPGRAFVEPAPPGARGDQTWSESARVDAFRGPSPAQIRADAAVGVVGTAAVVQLGLDSLFVDGRPVATLSDGVVDDAQMDGRVILPLHAALEASGRRRAVMDADVRVVSGLFLDALYTAGRAGAREFGVMAQAVDGSPGVIPIVRPAPPKLDDPPPASDRWVSVELTAQRVSVREHPGSAPEESSSAEFERITELARAVKRADAKANQMILSGSRDVPWSALMSAIAAGRGPTCSADPRTCLLTDVVFLAADAHAFDPSYEALRTMQRDYARTKAQQVSTAGAVPVPDE